MRINQYVAHATGLSRRSADSAIADGRIRVNGTVASVGLNITAGDEVVFDDAIINLPDTFTTIMLNKPAGYVVSRKQQGKTPTIYELLPIEFSQLKPIGRLDKDSSGLLLLSNDGELINRWLHPSADKWKRYEVTTTKTLTQAQQQQLEEGVKLEDGLSRLRVKKRSGNQAVVELQEGRNRQIRRTFAAIGHHIERLHRTDFGSYRIGNLASGQWLQVEER